MSLKAIAARVVRMVAEVTAQDAGALAVNVSGGDVEIPSRLATSVALVLNELTVNSIKHGFEEQGAGEISVEIRNGNGRIRVTFGDNGKGLPPFFELARDHGLGLQIVGNLIRDDLNGTFSLKPNDGKGTVAEITFASAAPSWPPRADGVFAGREPRGSRPVLTDMTAPLKVLVADDETIIAMGIETTLAKMGHAVVGRARTGERPWRRPSSCLPISSSWTSRCRIWTGSRLPAESSPIGPCRSSSSRPTAIPT